MLTLLILCLFFSRSSPLQAEESLKQSFNKHLLDTRLRTGEFKDKIQNRLKKKSTEEKQITIIQNDKCYNGVGPGSQGSRVEVLHSTWRNQARLPEERNLPSPS